MSNSNLNDFMELKKQETAAAIAILKGLLADPTTFKNIDEVTGRAILQERLETLESNINMTGDVTTHYHSSDRDLANSTGILPLANNSDEVTNHLNNVGNPNPHNLTYTILGTDLAGLTFENAGDAVNDNDLATWLQIQNLVTNAVAAINMSGYEPAFTKNTAFNKNFGTITDTVAEGNHNHDADYATINHNHDGIYEPTFTKNTAFNKNFGTITDTVAEGNHNHDGIYEPAFTKNTAFNKNFGTTVGTVAEGNHNHSEYELATDVDNIIGTTFDTAYYNNNQTVYGVFNDIKDKLNTKADTTTLDGKVDSNPTIGASTATKITYDDKGLVTAGTNLTASDIPNLDASIITGGTIDIARLPAAAIERLVPVADETARFQLTTATVQNGDTVKELSTGLLFAVTDDTQLDSAAGYTVYTAGTASSVDWSGITNKPIEFPPETHTLDSHSDVDGYANINPLMDGTATQGVSNRVAREDHVHPTDTSLQPLITQNTAFNKDFGTTVGTVAEGNHNHDGVYEPLITPNTAFNKNFGSTTDTVAKGEDVGDITNNPLTLTEPKNIINLFGQNAFDTAFFDDNKTVYGVFDNIKNKLNNKASAEMTGKIQMMPEFANCVFSALSFADTLGTMTTEHDMTENTNYYMWVSSETVVQSYAIVSFIDIPKKLDTWTGFSFFANTEGASSITMKVYDSLNNLIITKTASGLTGWTSIDMLQTELDTMNTSDWTNDKFKIIFEMSSANDEKCYLGNVLINYNKNI